MKLEKYKLYDQKDMHDIFASDTPYHNNCGIWGGKGIIKIPNTNSDYIFLVTLGSRRGTHIFDEKITSDGILTWQSQPQHKLSQPFIQRLIHHDEKVDNIYLFYRTQKNIKFTYLGLLSYVEHDPQKEQPVYFKWRILDWNPSADFMKQHQISWHSYDDTSQEYVTAEEMADSQVTSKKHSKELDIRVRNINFELLYKRNQEIGAIGELIILEEEKKRLRDAGKEELAKKVKLLSETNNTAPYDILSYEVDKTPKYIEVKSTKGDKYSQFNISRREVEFSKQKQDAYYLYRVYGLNELTKEAKYYVKRGNILENFVLTPKAYMAEMKSAGTL